MDNNIIKIIEYEVKKKCYSPDNFFGPTSFYHIKSVVKNSIFLAEKYNADVEIVTLAAWLHDIASVTKKEYYEDHHIHGAKIAEETLLELNYPLKKIELIKKCILNHRGSIIKDKTTKEEICVSDGDAISHFDNIPSLFYLAFVVREYSYEDGTEFVKNKLIRSYKKLSEESKEIYLMKYENAMSIFED